MDITKYNLVRQALADKGTDKQDLDVVYIPPKHMALKKVHSEEVLAAAMSLILDDKRILTGITPYESVTELLKQQLDPQYEVGLFVLMIYAVAVQQKWIRLSPILNKYVVDTDIKEIRQYVEEKHKHKL